MKILLLQTTEINQQAKISTVASVTLSYQASSEIPIATFFSDHCSSLAVMREMLLTAWDDRRMSKPCFDNSSSKLLQGERTQEPPRAGTEKSSCFQMGESMCYDFSLWYKYYPIYTQCDRKYVLCVLWTTWNQTMCRLDPAAMCILIFYAITYFRN